MNAFSVSAAKRQTILLAVIVGVVVANIYYIQPLLPTLAIDFSTSVAGMGTIAMLTQLGTAVGMLSQGVSGDSTWKSQHVRQRGGSGGISSLPPSGGSASSA